jgi:uroporphyrinogen-III synthase
MRVLITRPQAAAEQFVRLLETVGHEVIMSPVVRIEGTGTPIPDAEFDGLLATSANAFTYLQPRLPGTGGIRALPLYLVGERTALSARAHGFGNIYFVSPDAAELSEFLRRQIKPASRFLYLAGENRKAHLEESARADGHQVDIVVTYRAAAAEELAPDAVAALRAGDIDAVVHFSRRSAEIFVRLAYAADLAESSRKLKHFCLSPDVAAGLDALTPVCVKTASRPDSDSLLALLGSSAD